MAANGRRNGMNRDDTFPLIDTIIDRLVLSPQDEYSPFDRALFKHSQSLLSNGGDADDDSSFGERTLATSLCRECDDLLFSSAGDSRLPFSKQCFIRSAQNGHSDYFCPEHGSEMFQLYCNSCCKPICQECSVTEHHGHQLVYLQDAVEQCKSLLAKCLSEARSGVRLLEDGIKHSSHAARMLELRAQSVAHEVRQCIQRHVCALEKREKELLRQVEHVRHVKTASLHSQLNEMRQGLTTLQGTVHLTETLLSGKGELDVLEAKERVLQDMRLLQQLRAQLQPREDDLVSFQTPDISLLAHLLRLGHVHSSAYASCCQATGEGLVSALRGRMASFVIQAFDHLGEARLTGGDQFSVLVQSPDGVLLNGEVVDRQNGSYLVSYRPLVEGVHVLSVHCRGRAIQESPFQVRVRSPRNYANVGAVLVEFGGAGSDEGKFSRPWGICCDKQGNLVVADRSNNRIQLFSADGTFLRKFGSRGTKNGQFDRPAGVAVDVSRERIIVADKDNHRVQVFSMDGSFLFGFGERGSRQGQFCYPWGVAVNAQGEIAVSDTRNHRVQLFTSEGKFVCKFGFDGPDYKCFDSPRGVAFDKQGRIVCSDFNNHRLVVLVREQGHLFVDKMVGSEGTGPGLFHRPNGVAVDSEGNLVVADTRNNRIQVFSANGLFLASFGSPGNASAQFDQPQGVCVTAEGFVAVVDFGNNRVQLF